MNATDLYVALGAIARWQALYDIIHRMIRKVIIVGMTLCAVTILSFLVNRFPGSIYPHLTVATPDEQ